MAGFTTRNTVVTRHLAIVVTLVLGVIEALGWVHYQDIQPRRVGGDSQSVSLG